MNRTALIEKLKHLAKDNNVSFNYFLSAYFYESFLSRLAKSQYKNHFYLKGGLLLSSMVGINLRQTMDIDFLLKNAELDETTITKMLNDIFQFSIGDDIVFELNGFENIMQDDAYGGLRAKIVGHLENIRVPFDIDIAVGDPITGKNTTYIYKTIFGSEVSLLSYNLETYLAEKLQTIYERGILNSRCKDFYDVYICFCTKKLVIDARQFKEALATTFSYRKTTLDKTNYVNELRNIGENDSMNTRWAAYSRKNNFASHLDFKDVIESIIVFVSTYFE